VAARRSDAGYSRPSPQPRSAPASAASPARRDQPGQLVSGAGSAIVTAARMGRLLGRSGWRLARQLPGMTLVEQQANRLRQAASAELLRLLEVPQQYFGTAAPEEQRVMMLVQDANSDPTPLRTAMTELLTRSSESGAGRSKEYLFGTIVSQLVPDEARVLAALAQGKRYAVVDVAAKHVGAQVSAGAATVALTEGTGSLSLTDSAVQAGTYVNAISPALSDGPAAGSMVSAWIYVPAGSAQVHAHLYTQDGAGRRSTSTDKALSTGWNNLSFSTSLAAVRVGAQFTKGSAPTPTVYLDQVDWS